MTPWEFRVSAYTLLASFFLRVSSRQVNVTIDDEFGDDITGAKPVYSPDTGLWTQGSTCTGCGVRSIAYPQGEVQASQAFHGTWHDATYLSGYGSPCAVTLTFNGTAVVVFNLIANAGVEQTNTNTSVDFFLDGALAGSYLHEPDSEGPSVLYNVPVFSKSGLPHQPHTLVMQADTTTFSLILFDHAIYTVDDGSDVNDDHVDHVEWPKWHPNELDEYFK
ncbi:uncharacterized protein BXZ73DRAFT_77617 [Epithele typhae]|uniref:uncharacterized protein n=1 Tax=Epithele typhae TaxID=378194 RepID=UPI002008C311|nr:uncharacterized protein BXZ73DRAFT_77617 [Epithele typhae]KAH9932121.1 hypothetical protein BXZ73DRAFT_77617 [Epithele typhae]